MKKLLAILIFITLTFSCKKFPEDEALFHINTVKQRLCRQWSLFPKNPNSPLYDNYCPYVFFKSDGKFTSCAILQNYVTWQISENKNKITLREQNTSTSLDLTIIRLDIDYLILKNDTMIISFKPHP